MPFQICIKTDKSLRELATEMQQLLSLPSFKHNTSTEVSYCQFETLGLFILIRLAEDTDHDPEVADYPYRFELQCSFTEHELDTDTAEYQLQPYYAQLLSFSLGVETAYFEKQKIGPHWQIRYCFCRKNPHWDGTTLYGEEGWEPAVISSSSGHWRTIQPLL